MLTVLTHGLVAAEATLTATTCEQIKSTLQATTTGQQGIFYPMSMVTIADVKDGSSNTILCGEKYMMPSKYSTGTENGDQWTCYCGDDVEIVRYGSISTTQACMQDREGYVNGVIWGSSHASTLNMAFCDGSVRQISYGIAASIFNQLINRNDGQSIDASMY